MEAEKRKRNIRSHSVVANHVGLSSIIAPARAEKAHDSGSNPDGSIFIHYEISGHLWICTEGSRAMFHCKHDEPCSSMNPDGSTPFSKPLLDMKIIYSKVGESMRRLWAAGIGLLLVFSSFALVGNVEYIVEGESTNNQVLVDPVHNVDTGEYFTTIQAAIDDSDTVDGHTIEVSAGTYFEHVIFDKNLTLKGENRN